MIRTSFAARNSANFRPASHFALALALATGAVATVAMTSAPAYAQEKPKYSKNFQKAANPAALALQQLQKDAELTAVVTQLAAADAAAKPALRAQLESKTGITPKIAAMNAAVETADDRYTAGQYTLNWGVISGDTAMQSKGLIMSLDSGKTPADKLSQYNWFVGSIAFQEDDFPPAQKYIAAAIDNGWTQNDPVLVLGESYFRANQIEAGADVTLKYAASHPAVFSEDALRNALKHAYDGGQFYSVVKLVTLMRDRFPSTESTNYFDNVPRQTAGDISADALNAANAKLLAENANSDNWSFAVSAVVENSNYTEAEGVDAMRLLQRTKALRKRQEYLDYLQGLNPALYPTEAKSVIDAGLAGGFVGNGDVAEAIAQARSNAGADSDYLKDSANRSRASSNPKVAASLANAALSLGDAAKAQEFFEMVVSNGGADVDTSLIRLGIARLDQGNVAGAQEAFGRVTGKHKNLASLWSIYAASKAAPTAM